MGIFIHTKFVSSSEFECNSNALIFSSNAHVLRYIKSSICLTKKDAKHSIKEMVEQLGNGISSHSQELFCMSLQYFEFLCNSFGYFVHTMKCVSCLCLKIDNGMHL
jgi:hypothetical protein